MSATDDHSLGLLITCFMNYDLILEAAAAYCKHETLRTQKAKNVNKFHPDKFQVIG